MNVTDVLERALSILPDGAAYGRMENRVIDAVDCALDQLFSDEVRSRDIVERTRLRQETIRALGEELASTELVATAIKAVRIEIELLETKIAALQGHTPRSLPLEELDMLLTRVGQHVSRRQLQAYLRATLERSRRQPPAVAAE